MKAMDGHVAILYIIGRQISVGDSGSRVICASIKSGFFRVRSGHDPHPELDTASIPAAAATGTAPRDAVARFVDCN
jgi:hypothetical protein